jgi:beta-barrel assembly-enhancing protease
MQYGTLPVILIGGMAGFAIYQSLGVAVPLGFLKFSRGFESEADMLGLQYVYKTGYDPTAFVDFFEKIESQEKKNPGLMSKLFATHPPTRDRIRNSQATIQKYLKAKPEYVLNTSEFDDVQMRLIAMYNSRTIDNWRVAVPTLRRNPNGQIDSNGDEKSPQAYQEDRPTLKRGDN